MIAISMLKVKTVTQVIRQNVLSHARAIIIGVSSDLKVDFVCLF